ncbi:phosphoribosyltransferase family protein [Actinopolymorpha rutila]|uniref:Adenine phosphoribosyltransferase n=1 Tax=Actinopolymorpha rutila TaxID=446787 RepID=A0A852ZIX8_9ACTN|nr:phosphoribosyltransferase family protein [Actinopolymorpha rutila]NYH92914.1 adenine phosphoribosyltransferase [Actinopolymorpha rutila]
MADGVLTGTELRERLQRTFEWLGDRTDYTSWANVTSWWRDPELLRALGPALADQFNDTDPTVVLGLQSRGCLLGALVACHLGVGLVEVRKNEEPAAHSERLWQRTTPPDYEDRHLTLGFRRDLMASSDRVLLVDDWIATGSQALACHQLVGDAGATWLGTSVIVDCLERPELRRPLNLRAILHARDL